MGMMGFVTNIEYDEQANEVIFRYLLNEEFIPIELIEVEGSKDIIKMALSDKEMRANINLMIEAGAGLVAEFKGSLTDKRVKIKFSLDDLKEVKNNPMSEDDMNREMSKLGLARINALCPTDLGDGLIMERVYDDGDNIVYVYKGEEAGGNISEAFANIDEVKQEMVSSGIFEDMLMKNEIKVMTSVGKGLVYRYIGSESGEVVDIVFTKEELESFL